LGGYAADHWDNHRFLWFCRKFSRRTCDAHERNGFIPLTNRIAVTGAFRPSAAAGLSGSCA
jgi:hypothetical protein